MKITTILFVLMSIALVLTPSINGKRIKTSPKNTDAIPEFSGFKSTIVEIFIELSNERVIKTDGYYRVDNLIENPFGIDLIILESDFAKTAQKDEERVNLHTKICDILEPYDPASITRTANFFIPFERIKKMKTVQSGDISMVNIILTTDKKENYEIKMQMDTKTFDKIYNLKHKMRKIITRFIDSLGPNELICEEKSKNCDLNEDKSQDQCLNPKLMKLFKRFIKKAKELGLVKEEDGNVPQVSGAGKLVDEVDKIDSGKNQNLFDKFINKLCAKHSSDLNENYGHHIAEATKTIELKEYEEVVLKDLFRARIYA